MGSLENLVRFESANSGIAFRKSLYAPGEDDTAVADCIALANAELQARRRYLFLGVDDVPGGHRRLIGVDRRALAAFRKRFLALVAAAIEPVPTVDVRGITIDSRLIGVIRLKNCFRVPYLTATSVGGKLPGGVGFIRRGARNMSLTRSDLQRMFASQAATGNDRVPIAVGFPGARISERTCLQALGLRKLPSQLAAERLEGLLAGRRNARKVLTENETRFHRLMHAKYYGADAPFEAHSDESLRIELRNVACDNETADNFYRYEVRAHKLGLVAANHDEIDYHDAVLRLAIRVIPGIGVADRVYAEADGATVRDGYPLITDKGRKILIEADIGTLQSGRQVNVFREPPRFWAREEAASRTVTVTYELVADELEQPVTGRLYIDIEPESIRSV